MARYRSLGAGRVGTGVGGETGGAGGSGPGPGAGPGTTGGTGTGTPGTGGTGVRPPPILPGAGGGGGISIGPRVAPPPFVAPPRPASSDGPPPGYVPPRTPPPGYDPATIASKAAAEAKARAEIAAQHAKEVAAELERQRIEAEKEKKRKQQELEDELRKQGWTPDGGGGGGGGGDTTTTTEETTDTTASNGQVLPGPKLNPLLGAGLGFVVGGPIGAAIGAGAALILGPKLSPPEMSAFGETRLQRGSRGDSVSAVQRALLSIGYSVGATGADGDFGVNTENAVKAFQKDHGLFQTGIIDATTVNAMSDAGADWSVSPILVIDDPLVVVGDPHAGDKPNSKPLPIPLILGAAAAALFLLRK